MQTYVGDIIDMARRDTQNFTDIPTTKPASTDTGSGIYTDDFLRYVNWGQQRLLGKILKKYPFAFHSRKEISLVASQQAYDVDDNLYLGTKIVKVELSRTGNAKDYYRIPPAHPYFPNNREGWPCAYVRMNGQVLLEPTPSTATGTMRVTFQRALDRLDLRRALVDGTPATTDIVLDTVAGGAITALEESYITAARYVCVNDADGIPMLYNGLVASYNGGTDTLTLAANVSTYLETGYALADLDAGYLTIGKYTTTHSKLVEDAERYLVEYTNRRMFKREVKDSTTDLTEIEDEIVANYRVPDMDIKEIPISDYDHMLYPYNEY